MHWLASVVQLLHLMRRLVELLRKLFLVGRFCAIHTNDWLIIPGQFFLTKKCDRSFIYIPCFVGLLESYLLFPCRIYAWSLQLMMQKGVLLQMTVMVFLFKHNVWSLVSWVVLLQLNHCTNIILKKNIYIREFYHL